MVFSDSGSRSIRASLGLGWREIALEWSLIALAVLAFSVKFLDLGTRRMLLGNEAEIFQSLDRVVINSLSTYGQFPLWNPYIRTGVPLVADPFMHLYNPLVTVPELLCGVPDGFKIGLMLSFLAAGLGMWWMGAVLGLGRASRLWMALMYAFTGQAVAKFFQGHYDFVLGFPWIPWALASLMAATQTRRRLHVAMAAVSLALLFFSGNSYYAYYMLFAAALYAMTALFDIRRERPLLVVDWDRLKTLGAVGFLAVGLIALEAFPSFEFWPHISKAINPQMTDSHTVPQILLDFLSSDPWRSDALRPWLRPEEYYAYVGIAPFLALLLLPLIRGRRRGRHLLFLGLLLLLVVAWIDVKDMPWRDLYARTPWFNQFRYPTRILIFGAFALIALAGLGIDAAWQRAAVGMDWGGRSRRQGLGWIGRYAALGALAGLLVWSVADVYGTNRRVVGTRDTYEPIYEVMSWLRGYDSSEFFVSFPGDWYDSLYSNQLRYFDGHYGFNPDIRSLKDAVNQRRVEARPHYQVTGNDKPPADPDAVAVQRFPNYAVYRLPHSLPFAFIVKNQVLMDRAGGRELQSEDVSPIVPYIPGPNGAEIIAQGQEDSMLVVLTTLYPGWEVTVDGRKQALKNVGGYLATDLRPGVHKYVFSFTSTPFAIGILVSLLALVATMGLVATDLGIQWRKTLAGWKAFAGESVDFLQRPAPGSREMSEAMKSPQGVDARAATWKTFDAVYENGSLKPLQPVDLSERSRVTLTLVGESAVRGQVGMPVADRTLGAPAMPTFLRLLVLSRTISLEWALFAVATEVYLLTRLWALDQFPIYFFTDEAAGPLWAEQLISRGLRDAQGSLLPIYFEQAPQRWMPLLSVYFHLPVVALFGKSIIATRATSALVSVLGAVAVGLILKVGFKARYWWTGVLFMAISPAWFIHSRTAFETVIMASFYACFLLFYFLYRGSSPRYIFPTLMAGAVAFYSYSNGQAMMGTLGILLLLSDFRYHLRQWRTVVPALVVGVILAVPLIGFRISRPEAMQEHLHMIGSYLVEPIPLSEKVGRFTQLYLYALSPQYWFLPNGTDLARHVMRGYGHLQIAVLPLVAAGVGLCLWRIRAWQNRAILFAALATPAGAAVAGIGVTRVLAFVVPAGVLAGLGLELLAQRFAARVPRTGLAIAIVALMSVSGLAMLQQALTEGPLWFRDYGLYGMQYGAKQLFEQAIPEYLRSNPDTRLVVSPTWANGTDNFPRFFLSREQQGRMQMGTIDSFLRSKGNLGSNVVLVMTPPEYNRARTSNFFKSVQIDRVIPYPDGTPGFYFARLAYADNVDALMEADRERRRQLVEGQVQIGGQTVRVRHSQLDMGQLRDIFDGDRRSLARGAEANPFVLELTFPEPRPVSGLVVDVNNMEFNLSANLYAYGSDQPQSYSQSYPVDSSHGELSFADAPRAVSRMRVEIKNLRAGDTDHVHIYELVLQSAP